MPAYKYLRNINSGDGSSRVSFRDDRPDLVLGGQAVELSDEERARLGSRIVLEREGAKESAQSGDSEEDSQAKQRRGQPQPAEQKEE